MIDFYPISNSTNYSSVFEKLMIRLMKIGTLIQKIHATYAMHWAGGVRLSERKLAQIERMLPLLYKKRDYTQRAVLSLGIK